MPLNEDHLDFCMNREWDENVDPELVAPGVFGGLVRLDGVDDVDGRHP
jgi:hypothetical protein